MPAASGRGDWCADKTAPRRRRARGPVRRVSRTERPGAEARGRRSLATERLPVCALDTFLFFVHGSALAGTLQ